MGEKGEERRQKQKFPSQRMLKFHYIVQEYSSEELQKKSLEMTWNYPQVVKKNNFKCLNNSNKTTGGGSYRNSMVTCTPKERQEDVTNSRVHTSEHDFADTRTLYAGHQNIEPTSNSHQI